MKFVMLILGVVIESKYEIKRNSCRWSWLGAARFLNYHNHIQREHCFSAMWLASLMRWHGSDWLADQRLKYSTWNNKRRKLDTKIGCRKVAGFVGKRWDDGLVDAFALIDGLSPSERASARLRASVA